MKLKTLMRAVAGLALVAGMSALAKAATFDTFTLTVTPNGNRGVIINTTTFDFTNVDLGVSTVTKAIPVMTTGTVTDIEYDMKGTLAGGWSLSTDGTSDVQNELEVRCLFNTTYPGSFNTGTTNLLITTDKGAGSAGADTNFEGDADVDNMGLEVTKDLYVYFKLPPTTSTSAQQTLTVTVTAGVGN